VVWRDEPRKGGSLEDLVNIGVRTGDCLALGVSLRSVGWIEGGPDALIGALLDAVGEEGTIFIPSFTRAFNLPLSRRRKRLRVFRSGGEEVVPWDYIFDPGKTPPETGAVPAAMWRRDDSIRSIHPTNSVVAMGRLAEFITRDHDASAPNFLPYKRLLEVRAGDFSWACRDAWWASGISVSWRLGLWTSFHPTWG